MRSAHGAGQAASVRPSLKRVLRSNPGARLILQRPDEPVKPLADYADVPPLEAPVSIDPDSYIGPTEESNWVIPSRMLVGAYPGATEDELNSEILTSILELGVTTFVCLQSEYQHHGVTEEQWRSGEKLRPYIFDALQLLETCPADYFPEGRKPDSLDFVHLPIVDCATVSDGKVLSLAYDLCRRLKAGENLYVHCWGGHGRTGTVVSLMLGIMYGLPPMAAMAWVQMFHDMRIAPCGVPSPQTAEQRKQVTRILVKVGKRRDAAVAAEAAAKVAAEAAAAKATAAASRAQRRSIAAQRGAGDPFAQYRGGGDLGGHRGPTPDAMAGTPTSLALPPALTGDAASLTGTASASERLPHTARGGGGHTGSPLARSAAVTATPLSAREPGRGDQGVGGRVTPSTAWAAPGQGGATPGERGEGRVSPSSPPPPARTPPGAGPTPEAAQPKLPTMPSAPTPPPPVGQGEEVVGGPAHGGPTRETSLDTRHTTKMRRTGRSYEPVTQAREHSNSATPRPGRAADTSISSTHSDVVLTPVGHAASPPGGGAGTPRRVHPTDATTKVSLGAGGGLSRKDTGSSMGSGKGGLMWKQPEVESWVDRLAKRRGKVEPPSASSRSKGGKSDAGVMRLAGRKSRRRKGASSTSSSATSGAADGAFGSVKSKVPSRRVSRRKGRSSSRRKGRRGHTGTSSTPRSTASASTTGTLHLPLDPAPSLMAAPLSAAGSALGRGSEQSTGGPSTGLPMLSLGAPTAGTPLLGALPVLGPGKGGVTAGQGGAAPPHAQLHGPPTTARSEAFGGGLSGREPPTARGGSTRAIASALTSGTGSGGPSSLAAPFSAAAHSAESLGHAGSGPSEHALPSSASTSIMQQHRKLVRPQAGSGLGLGRSRAQHVVASRGGGGHRSLKPPSVVMG